MDAADTRYVNQSNIGEPVMSGLIVSGLVVAVCALVTLSRMNLRRWLGYAGFVDISFTVLLLSLFAGTFSGTVAAAFAGLWLTVLLLILRKTLGCEKYQAYYVGWRRGFIRFHWKRYNPSDLTWFGVKKEQAT